MNDKNIYSGFPSTTGGMIPTHTIVWPQYPWTTHPHHGACPSCGHCPCCGRGGGGGGSQPYPWWGIDPLGTQITWESPVSVFGDTGTFR